MSMLMIITLSLMCAVISSSQPMMMILMTALIISFSSVFAILLKMTWISMLVILALVGGLLILYILITSQSPNEGSPQKIDINKILPIIPFLLFSWSPNNRNTKDQINLAFKMNWTIIISIFFLLLMVTLFCSKMITSPSKSMKSCL